MSGIEISELDSTTESGWRLLETLLQDNVDHPKAFKKLAFSDCTMDSRTTPMVRRYMQQFDRTIEIFFDRCVRIVQVPSSVDSGRQQQSSVSFDGGFTEYFARITDGTTKYGAKLSCSRLSGYGNNIGCAEPLGRIRTPLTISISNGWFPLLCSPTMPAFHSGMMLQDLDISFTNHELPVSDWGLLDVLKGDDCHLRKLTIALMSEELVHLFNAIAVNSSLEHLDVSNSHRSAESDDALADCIAQAPPRLRYIKVDDACTTQFRPNQQVVDRIVTALRTTNAVVGTIIWLWNVDL